MLAGQLLSIAQDMLSDYDELHILATLEKAVLLAESRPTLNKAQFQQELRAITVAAERILENSITRLFPIELKRILSQSNYSQSFPEAVARLLIAGVSRQKKESMMSSAELKMYLEGARSFYNQMASLAATATAFGVETYDTPEGQVSLEILIPDRVYERKLADLVTRLGRFERFLAVLSEVATGSRGDLRLGWAATSEFAISIAFDPVTVACILVAYERILAVVEKHLSIVKMVRDLKKSNVPTADAVAETLRSGEKAALEEAVRGVINEFADGMDKGRRNELEIEFSKAAEAIVPDIAAGARLRITARDQVTLMNVDDVRDDVEGSPKQEQLERLRSIEVKLDALLADAGHEALGLIEVENSHIVSKSDNEA